MGSTIVLPEKITCVYNGEIYPMPDSLRRVPKLLVYIDSTECTTCRISHIGEYRRVVQISEETGSFAVILLIANTYFESIPLSQYLLDLGLTIPIYIDESVSFYEKNPFFPVHDYRLHALLLDNGGKPLFFGDPSRSERLFESFRKAARKIENHF